MIASLQDRDFRPGTPEYGEAFETFLHHELVCYRDYVAGEPLSYWRSTSSFEVDFLLGDHTAIEVKASANVGPQDLKGLRACAEESKTRRLLCVCLATTPRTVDGIEIVPWQHFLESLWNGDYR